MSNRLTRITATGVAAASLALGAITASGASAKAPDPQTIDPHTWEAQAPADSTAGEEVGAWYNLPDGTAVSYGVTTALADGRLD